jgi:hypothetical protein
MFNMCAITLQCLYNGERKLLQLQIIQSWYPVIYAMTKLHTLHFFFICQFYPKRRCISSIYVQWLCKFHIMASNNCSYSLHDMGTFYSMSKINTYAQRVRIEQDQTTFCQTNFSCCTHAWALNIMFRLIIRLHINIKI